MAWLMHHVHQSRTGEDPQSRAAIGVGRHKIRRPATLLRCVRIRTHCHHDRLSTLTLRAFPVATIAHHQMDKAVFVELSVENWQRSLVCCCCCWWWWVPNAGTGFAETPHATTANQRKAIGERRLRRCNAWLQATNPAGYIFFASMS